MTTLDFPGILDEQSASYPYQHTVECLSHRTMRIIKQLLAVVLCSLSCQNDLYI